MIRCEREPSERSGEYLGCKRIEEQKWLRRIEW